MNVRSGSVLRNFARFMSSKPKTNNEIKPMITNRNPRNLEKMRLARKPTGFFFEKDSITFWHKLVCWILLQQCWIMSKLKCVVSTYRLFLRETRSGVTAELMHHTEKVVVKASTNEWAISQFLYSNIDRMAYITLAKVFAERCLESGISCCDCSVEAKEDTNVSKISYSTIFYDLLL